MATKNPSLDRRWIQTHGLPIDKLTAAVRAEIDQANSTKVADGAQRVVLFDEAGAPICSIDFMPNRYQRIAEISKPDAEPVQHIGDTTIRKISATEAAAVGASRDYFDPAREVPPIDLPDYQPDDDGLDSGARARRVAAIVIGIWIAIAAAYLLAAYLSNHVS